MPHSGVIEQLCARTLASQDAGRRVLVAVTGPPGAGKSTIAADLVTALRAQQGAERAALVAMDGFHLDNSELHAEGLLSVKGAPETFDTTGFLALVQDVRADKGDLRYPLFDRAQDKTLPDAANLPAATRIVVFEGNYLLLQRAGWSSLAGMFDLTAFLTVPLPVLRARLVARWLEYGLSQADAAARADSNDMANARTVLEHSGSPDLVLVTQSDGQITMGTGQPMSVTQAETIQRSACHSGAARQHRGDGWLV